MSKISDLPVVLSVTSSDIAVVNTLIGGIETTATITLSNLFQSMGITVAPTGFPGALPNCIVWLKASDFNSGTTGDEVSIWNDYSGNANNFTAIGSTGNIPTVDLNSINTTMTSVLNVGSKRGLQNSALDIGPSNWTIFAVLRFNAVGTYFLSPGSTSSSQSRFGLNSSSQFEWTISGVSNWYSNETIGLNQWIYFVMTNNGGIKTVYINGTALTWQTTPSTASGNNTGICIIDGHNGTSEFNGQLAEIALYTFAVNNTQQVNDLQNYAKTRYNLL